MSIKDLPEKIKSFGKPYFEHVLNSLERRDVFISLMIVLIASASFGLGRISTQKVGKSSIRIEGSVAEFSGLRAGDNIAGISAGLPQNLQNKGTGIQAATLKKAVFASKSGKRYYYPSCSSRVTEANKIWFESAAKAEAMGLTLAANCLPN